MKKLLLVSALLVTGSLSMAQQIGRVVSSTPIIQQVTVPHQVCTTEQMAVQQPKSGAGALMGAIAGGAIGNAVGQGAGRGLATMFGVISGAALGDSVEALGGGQFQNVQRCTTQNSYESRPVAYNVVYEFGGRQYSVQMPNDPGPTLQLQVTPVGASAPSTPPASVVTYAQPVYQQPTYIVEEPVVYYSNPGYGYYSQPNYLPVAAVMGMGLWFGSRGGHSHRRWH